MRKKSKSDSLKICNLGNKPTKRRDVMNEEIEELLKEYENGKDKD